MPSHRFDLTFNGYWREPNIAGIPTDAGIFCVYVCTFNPTEKTVALLELIYIGESENVRKSVGEHHLWPTWRAKKTAHDQQICFSFAPVTMEHCERIAAALIHANKPPINSDFKDSFPFGETIVSVTGRASHLHPTITVPMAG